VTALTDSDDFQPNEFREPVEPRKCVRHRWVIENLGFGNQRSVCFTCNKPKDETLSRRGKQSRNYGNRAELTAARKYGGDKIGAAGGPVDIRGKEWNVQMKTHRRLPPAEWRKAFQAMQASTGRMPRLLLRFLPGPGLPPDDYMVVPGDVWLDYFGRDDEMVEGDPYTVELAQRTK
jgi:hypothetical protein